VAQYCFCGCGRKLRFTKVRAAKFGSRVAARHDELVDAEEIATVFPHYQFGRTPLIEHGRELVAAWVAVAHGEARDSKALWLATNRYLDVADKVLDTMYAGGRRPRRL
jgi:hypothetical protein